MPPHGARDPYLQALDPSEPRRYGTPAVALLRKAATISGPEVRRDYPLNLSISISGGKETNKDSPSNGE